MLFRSRHKSEQISGRGSVRGNSSLSKLPDTKRRILLEESDSDPESDIPSEEDEEPYFSTSITAPPATTGTRPAASATTATSCAQLPSDLPAEEPSQTNLQGKETRYRLSLSIGPDPHSFH